MEIGLGSGAQDRAHEYLKGADAPTRSLRLPRRSDASALQAEAFLERRPCRADSQVPRLTLYPV